jgi:hypothetical protein
MIPNLQFANILKINLTGFQNLSGLALTIQISRFQFFQYYKSFQHVAVQKEQILFQSIVNANLLHALNLGFLKSRLIFGMALYSLFRV